MAKIHYKKRGTLITARDLVLMEMGYSIIRLDEDAYKEFLENPILFDLLYVGRYTEEDDDDDIII